MSCNDHVFRVFVLELLDDKFLVCLGRAALTSSKHVCNRADVATSGPHCANGDHGTVWKHKAMDVGGTMTVHAVANNRYDFRASSQSCDAGQDSLEMVLLALRSMLLHDTNRSDRLPSRTPHQTHNKRMRSAFAEGGGAAAITTPRHLTGPVSIRCIHSGRCHAKRNRCPPDADVLKVVNGAMPQLRTLLIRSACFLKWTHELQPCSKEMNGSWKLVHTVCNRFSNSNWGHQSLSFSLSSLRSPRTRRVTRLVVLDSAPPGRRTAALRNSFAEWRRAQTEHRRFPILFFCSQCKCHDF